MGWNLVLGLGVESSPELVGRGLGGGVFWELQSPLSKGAVTWGVLSMNLVIGTYLWWG